MKFGSNLNHLSIPEWRCYNLDYNDLKSQIRVITQTKSQRLNPLKQSFVDNFDYINLFIRTKHGELVRKVEYFSAQYKQVSELAAKLIAKEYSIDNVAAHKQELRSLFYSLEDIFYNTIEISIVVKNLTKFILIQKIAVKKILKKFLKYYTVDTERATAFVTEVKNYLVLNKDSFFNFDLSDLTRELTDLMKDIKSEQQLVISKIKNKSPIQGLPSNPPEDTKSKEPQDTVTHQQRSNSNDSKFDLTSLLKKNFSLHFLVANDPNTLSSLILNLNMFLNFKGNNESSSEISYIYLLDPKNLEEEPSYILSQNGQPYSTVVAYTGGLRKYSYCALPNDIIQSFLDYLVDRENDLAHNTLTDFFKSNPATCLTKVCIDTILEKKLKPSLKLICKRLRYMIRKDHEEKEHHENEESNIIHKDSYENRMFYADEGHSNFGDTSDRTTKSNEVKKKYQDDYLLTLDHDIYTTNNPALIGNIQFYKPTDNEFSKYDLFPHSHVTFYSNDSNLCNFEKSLDMEIDVKNGLVDTKYPTSNLRKLPIRIQDIIATNNSLILFKGLHFYSYMISCYFNVVPQNELVNNHYTNLLNLNLLKNYESVENFNNQINRENSIVKAESSHVSKRKLSMKSFETNSAAANASNDVPTASSSYGAPEHPSINRLRVPLVTRNSTISVASTKYSIPSIFTSRFDDDEIENDFDVDDDRFQFESITKLNDEDYYSLYVKMNDKYEGDNSLFTSFILKSNKIKNRLVNRLGKLFNSHKDDYGQYSPRNISSNEYPYNYHNFQPDEHNTFVRQECLERGVLDTFGEETHLFSDPYTTAYDSINEEPPTFLNRNKYLNIHQKYEYDYDQTLAYIYFSLNLVCIFLSGIEFGIVYSIFREMEETPQPDSQFSVINNLWLILILIIGLLSSLIFSMISINLIFQRYSPAPLMHSFCVWGGFTIVSACCVWSTCMFVQGML